ncbi:DUF2567 domain-containing protein [Mycolicibacterium sediminis]|uniref:Membrane protein n=1 Tax=Mycolicibacterium sediminis TaxID=1286180 RepID=A0A7I7QTZ8_9MYCO|nr:DUF2567 domain-containing protein [Mycolicibacterium sediminis]BBY29791.1 membrane protein [Mycolicibacterium sediminis]
MTHSAGPVLAPPSAQEPPRTSRQRAAVTLVAALTLAGVLVGAAWAWLAPGISAAIGLNRSGERVHGYVGDGADHLFLGAFLLVGMVSVVAIVAAVWAWRWRAHRGPLTVTALSVGAMAAAGAAAGVGAALAHWRHGAVDMASAPVSPERRVYYLTEAPAVFFGHTPLQIALTVVFPAGIAALVYAVFTLSTLRDDLGAWPPVETAFGHARPMVAPPAPAAATDPARTADDVPPVDPGSPSR